MTVCPANYVGNHSMLASYYFWHWADNDLPGRPAEILPDLLAGRLPPALAPFDARPLCAALVLLQGNLGVC